MASPARAGRLVPLPDRRGKENEAAYPAAVVAARPRTAGNGERSILASEAICTRARKTRRGRGATSWKPEALARHAAYPSLTLRASRYSAAYSRPGSPKRCAAGPAARGLQKRAIAPAASGGV